MLSGVGWGDWKGGQERVCNGVRAASYPAAADLTGAAGSWHAYAQYEEGEGGGGGNCGGGGRLGEGVSSRWGQNMRYSSLRTSTKHLSNACRHGK